MGHSEALPGGESAAEDRIHERPTRPLGSQRHMGEHLRPRHRVKGVRRQMQLFTA